VNWAGDPAKPLAAESDERLRPRRSFAAWKEEVRFQSHPWTASDLEAADELQRRTIEIDIERRLASEQRAVRARDDLLAIVSHDLKSPLSAILLQADAISTRASGCGEDNARLLREVADRLRQVSQSHEGDGR
jgi:light-regulated signal transduction histidine kinase (bacteriophytochrome)